MRIDDNMIYNSCPECRKKVQEDPVGYRCENCNKVHMTMVPQYMFSAKVSDLSGSIYISFPGKLGDVIMGNKTAEEFQDFKNNSNGDPDIMRNYLLDHVHNRYH